MTFIPISPALSTFSLCTYNICSLQYNDHISALNDLIETHHPNTIALTETWTNKSSTHSEIANATPFGYTQLSKPRTTNKNHISDKTLSGGTAFLIPDSISIILNHIITKNHWNVHLIHSNCLLHLQFLTSIARLHHQIHQILSAHQSLSRWNQNFSIFCCNYFNEFIITGDFNMTLYDLDDLLDSSSQQFIDLLSSVNLIQHVSVSTHIHWISLSLLLTLISPQQYHILLLLYLITFLFSLISTLQHF